MKSPDGAHLNLLPHEGAQAAMGSTEERPQRSTADLAAFVESCTLEALLAEIEGDGFSDRAYSMVGGMIARGMLDALRQHPATPLDDEHLWPLYKEHITPGEEAEAISGRMSPTGFQVGWAVNAVRAICEQPAIANPAIVEVGP